MQMLKNILRVPCDIFFEQKWYDRCLDYCLKHIIALDEIIFFTQISHAIRNPQDVCRRLEFIGTLMNRFRGRSVKMGIDVLCSVGQLGEFTDSSLSDYDFFMGVNGQSFPARLCPTSPKTMEYLRLVYSCAAEQNPDSIYIDDDLHHGSDCRCPHCESLLSARGPISDEARHLFTKDRICALLSQIEHTVHHVNPKITLGWMTCFYGPDGRDYSPYVEALRGKQGGEVVWRPGGGVYNDDSVSAMVAKAHSIARQNSVLPNVVTERYAEVENFPYVPLRKSPDFTTFEALSYLASGCTGVAYNVMGTAGRFEEYIPYLNILDECSALATAIVELGGCAPSVGIGKPLPDFPDQKEMAEGDEIYQVGLPPAYRTEQSVCHILPGKIARRLGKEQLLDILTGGVMMDGEALGVLNDSGLGKYTGFKASLASGDWVEQGLPHSMVSRIGGLRDLHPVLRWVSPIYRITKTDDRAEYLTRLLDYGGCEVGMASGIFVNELGGRVYVSGFAPFDWQGCRDRHELLCRVFRFLSRDRLPAYLITCHKIALWHRANCQFLVNLTTGTANDIQLAVLTAKRRLTIIRRAGQQVRKEQLTAIGEDAPYKIFSISQLAYQEIVIVTE